ncbi:hypothetical protein H0E87_002615, partial [Populus deltoides]
VLSMAFHRCPVKMTDIKLKIRLPADVSLSRTEFSCMLLSVWQKRMNFYADFTSDFCCPYEWFLVLCTILMENLPGNGKLLSGNERVSSASCDGSTCNFL